MPRKADVERMSRVDTAWLRMDTEANPMMIVGVWLLEPRVDYDALCRRVEARMLRYPRFAQKVVEDALGASWVADTSFDIRRHVVRAAFAPRHGRARRAALQALVGELAATPLDPARPLWQFHLVERYDGDTSALVARIHHCIADGIALTAVMMSLMDGGAPPKRPTRREENGLLAEGGALAGLAARALELSGGSLDLARSGVQLAGDAAALALMPDDSPTRLKGKPARGKRVGWSEPMPLDAVKAVGRALGASVNDVLLATVAAAIGSWLEAEGEATRGKEIRAMVPVNLRPPGPPQQLGNRFGLVPLLLPIGLDNPVERVYAVRARMDALKGSFTPLLAFGLLAVAGLLVKPAQAALLDLFARKATAVMTNVPGPTAPVTLCGSTLRQAMFWVPQSGDIGVGVSILSYAGGVQFGLITDRRLCPDPQAIVDRFRPEFEKLLWLTLMLPWGEAG